MSANKMKDKTLKLLRGRPAYIKLAQVSEESGIALSWLKKFHSAGEKFNPSAEKLITLYEHLNKKSLKL